MHPSSTTWIRSGELDDGEAVTLTYSVAVGAEATDRPSVHQKWKSTVPPTVAPRTGVIQ